MTKVRVYCGYYSPYRKLGMPEDTESTTSARSILTGTKPTLIKPASANAANAANANNPGSQPLWPVAATSAFDATAAAIPIALGGVAIVYANFPAQYLSYGVFATLLLLILIHAVSATGGRPMAFSARLFEATALSAILHQFTTYMPAWGLAARPETLLALMCVVSAFAFIVCAVLFLLGADKFTRFIPAPVYAGFSISVAILLLVSQSKTLWHMWEAGQSAAVLISVCAAAIVANLAVRQWLPRLPASTIGVAAGALVALLWWLLKDTPVQMVMAANQALQLPWAVADFAALVAPQAKTATMLPTLLNNGALLGLMVFINMTIANESISQLDDRSASRWQHMSVALTGGLGAAVGAVPVAGSQQVSMAGMRITNLSNRSSFLIAIVCAILLSTGILNWIALAAVAGVMLCDAFFMADRSALAQASAWVRRRPLEASQKEDLALVAAVTVTAVVFNLVASVFVGLMFGLVLFAMRNAKKPVRFEWTGDQLHSNCARSRAEIEVLLQQGDKIKILELEAELFFGAVASLDRSLQASLEHAHTVILDWSRVRNVDSSIALSLKRWQRAAQALNIGTLHAGAILQKGNAHTFLAHHLPDAVSAPDLDRALEIAENNIISTSTIINPEATSMLQDAMAILKGLNSNQRDIIEATMQQRLYKSGDVVFTTGEASDKLLIVSHGSAGIIIHGDHGHDIRITSIRRGGVIGEVGFLDSAPRSATVVAQEDLLVYVLTRQAFNALRLSHPEIVYQLMLNLTLDLASRLRHTNKLASARSAGA